MEKKMVTARVNGVIHVEILLSPGEGQEEINKQLNDMALLLSENGYKATYVAYA